MKKLIKGAFLSLLFIFVCTLCAFAQENIINSVEISKPENSQNYQLKINSTKPADYKAHIDSQNSIYFDIKNAVAKDNLDTIYDNVSDIDGVIVQQIGNKVRIYVNGINTQDTELVFEAMQNTGSNLPSQIVVNRPMREYRPVNGLDDAQNSDWENNSFNAGHLASVMLNGLSAKKIDFTFVICIGLILLSLIGFRKVFKKIKFEEEPLIGLNTGVLKETNDYDIQTSKDELLNKLNGLKTSRQAPAQRSFPPARRQKVQQPIFKAAKENYALNAYQKSQKNPYVSEVQPEFKKPLQKPLQPDFKPQHPQPKSFQGGANIDNIKFLESVTKIYEKSGRKDLAMGIKANLSKTKTAI